MVTQSKCNIKIWIFYRTFCYLYVLS